MEIDVTHVVEDRSKFLKWDEQVVSDYVRERPLFRKHSRTLDLVREFVDESELFDSDAVWEGDYHVTQMRLVEVVMFDIRQLMLDKHLTDNTVIVAETPEFIIQVDQPGHPQYGRWLVQLFG